MKALLPLLVATVALVGYGCSTQPTPDCLIQYATGYINYAATYAEGTLVDAGNGTDCQWFTLSTPQQAGTPVYSIDSNGQPVPPAYKQLATGVIAGLPFNTSLLGLDKFYPSTGGYQLGMTPEILQGASITGTTASTGFGMFTSTEPDSQDLCHVPTVSAASYPYDFTESGADCTVAGNCTPVTFNYSNVELYVTALAQGTQIAGDVSITVGTCTASFKMIGYAPAATCVKIENDYGDFGYPVIIDSAGDPVNVNLPDGGTTTTPLVAGVNVTSANEQSNLCTNFSPISGDQQWNNYNANFLNSGNSVNQYFPLVCSPVTGYCILNGNTFPNFSNTARP